jgi:hypothetical protein
VKIDFVFFDFTVFVTRAVRFMRDPLDLLPDTTVFLSTGFFVFDCLDF